MSRRRGGRGARRRPVRAPHVPHGRETPFAERLEAPLRLALFAVFGLLLLTPFVVSPGTAYPLVVGKALWSRALIEIAFALWAVLALSRPGYGAPRSWLLVVLGAGLGVSLASAWSGVSVERSLWSDFERMQGVVDRAHWCVLAVVLAAVLRTPREWRTLLAASTVAGTAMASLVLARAAGAPILEGVPEPNWPRASGTFGNATYLGAYLLVHTVLAAGFAVRGWARAAAPGARASRAGAALGWSVAAALCAAGLTLAGSVGALAGAGAAAGAVALGFAWLASGRRRVAAVAAVAVLAVGLAGLSARFLDPERSATVEVARSAGQWPGRGAVAYLGSVHLDKPSVQSRLAAWEAGLEGFAERPLLGWGPGNFIAVFGRFASGYGAFAEEHDQAHGKLVEVAATTGVAGLAAWVALWGLALAVLLRAARAMDPPERALALFVAAALAGSLVQLQSLFDTVASTLPGTLLLALAARLEPGVLGERRQPRWPRWPRLRGGAVLARPAARAALGAAAVAVALGGLAANRAIYTAADVRYSDPAAVASMELARGIDAFAPLAYRYRMDLFEQLGSFWAPMRARAPARAGRLLEWADREAAAAVAAEPANWRIAHALARLYAQVARAEPEYAGKARRHLARARELAPNRAVFDRALARPTALVVDGRPEGTLALRWRPAPGAGYHEIQRSGDGRAWTTVLYAWEAARTEFVTRACPACLYRIRACRSWRDCSGWAGWR